MLFEQIVDMKKIPTIFIDNSAVVKLSYILSNTEGQNILNDVTFTFEN